MTPTKEAFKEFSEKNIDIELIAALKPTYEPLPSIDPEGKLAVKGFFPSEPIRVNFDLAFIPSDGEMEADSPQRQAGRSALISSPSTDKTSS